MILLASKEQAALRRLGYVTPSGAQTYVSTYIGTNAMELVAQGKPKPAVVDRTNTAPMAYLVEQVPDSVVHPHYHQVDQFQIFTCGSGHIGTHALDGVTVHYAGAHSPYGPIAAGPEGVAYLTLRRNWDPGARWMPGAAPALRELPDRKYTAYTSRPLQPTPHAQVGQFKGCARQELIASEANGLGAWLVQAGPGAPVQGTPAASDGMFLYLLSGSLGSSRFSLAAGTCIFFSQQEQPFKFEAGAQGAELVQVQFPLSS